MFHTSSSSPSQTQATSSSHCTYSIVQTLLFPSSDALRWTDGGNPNTETKNQSTATLTSTTLSSSVGITFATGITSSIWIQVRCWSHHIHKNIFPTIIWGCNNIQTSGFPSLFCFSALLLHWAVDELFHFCTIIFSNFSFIWVCDILLYPRDSALACTNTCTKSPDCVDRRSCWWSVGFWRFCSAN